MCWLLIILCSSFFQSVCTLGYCLLPLTLALLVLRILLSIDSLTPAIIFIKLALVGGSLTWSIWGELFCKIITVEPLSKDTPETKTPLWRGHISNIITPPLPPSSASLGFLYDYLAVDRRALAIYPLVLFYLSIGCLIATQKSGLFWHSLYNRTHCYSALSNYVIINPLDWVSS